MSEGATGVRMGTSARAAGKPIGLLGGTFDPVHNGHLRVAIEAFEALDLDHVRVLPLNQPGHRDGPQATVAQRLAMLAACVRPPLVLDRREIDRGGVSYTVDTLSELRHEWPGRALCLLLGRDAFSSLPRWHRASELLQLAHIVVAARPLSGVATDPALDELIANAHADRVDQLHDQPAGRVFILELPLLPIASSELRARRRGGRDVRHLVPDRVDHYITEHQLYRT